MDVVVQPGHLGVDGIEGGFDLAPVMGPDDLAAEVQDVAAAHQFQGHERAEVAGGQAEDGVGPGHGRGDALVGDDDARARPRQPQFGQWTG